MAVLNISLGMRYFGYSSEGSKTLDFHQYYDTESVNNRAVRLVFSTQFGTDTQASFDISITYRGYRKGSFVMSQPATKTTNVKAANANCTESGGRYWWSIPLETLCPSLTSGSTWSYASRVWDGVTLDVSIVCNWTGEVYEGLTRSWAFTDTLAINYVPTYTLTSAFYNSDGDLQIRYTATDWGRSDDRWTIESGTIGGADAFKSNTTGKVSGYGMIIVPKDRITRSLTGDTLKLRIGFNAEWTPLSTSFATLSTKTASTSDPSKETSTDPGITVNDWTKLSPSDGLYRCNTPRITAQRSADTESVVVTVRDSGNMGKPITHAIVGFTGYAYQKDKIDVKVGGSGRLLYPPLGKNVSVYAYGLDDEGGVSDTVTVTLSGAMAAEGPDDGVVVQSLENPSLLIFMRWRKDGETLLPTVKVTPNTETVQLSGRKRPSVYYGEGGTCEVNFSGWMIPEYDDWFLYDYTEMVETGVFMCRFYDGTRYVVSGEVTIEPDNAGNYKVSISGQEVDS